MTDLGFDRPLYILPFDHRGSFQSGLFGWKGPLSQEQTERVAASKAIIHDRVPAEQAELEELHGDKRAYDRSRRPRHMVDAIHELQDAGVEPDVWKIEGLDRAEDCEAVVAAARRAGRAGVGCIVLGRGEDEAKVESWLSTAARVPGFIGFAVGRTTFCDALVGWRDGRTTREAGRRR